MCGRVEARRRAAASLGSLAIGIIRTEDGVLDVRHQICVYNEILEFRSNCCMRD
jgi:hypothetical protein